jgi:hypothetical protein
LLDDNDNKMKRIAYAAYLAFSTPEGQELLGQLRSELLADWWQDEDLRKLDKPICPTKLAIHDGMRIAFKKILTWYNVGVRIAGEIDERRELA